MKKYKLISVGMVFLLFFGVFLNLNALHKDFQPNISYTQRVETLPSTANSNYQIIEDVFDVKASDYEDDGFFPQLYEPSLQATYYGLFILNSLGEIDVINESWIISYIMSHYNSSSGIFMDEYAARYLGTDFSYIYYPLSTLLEVNCYALLSLSLLGRLDLVNITQSVDFLWSCYNPSSSGFIGQPFDSNLEDTFKISTMDNTYFAIITLDLLMGSWSSYTAQKDELIIFINSLQNTNPIGWQYGGFYNDGSSSFNSLDKLFEPNLLAAYYCIKSLQVFGMESSINYASFYQFLDSLYNPTDHYFRMSLLDFSNFTNIVATAIGCELSEITYHLTITKDMIIPFLYNNRNAQGLWDGSTSINKYELIDTFQIIRAIEGAEEIAIFNSNDTQQIVESVLILFSSSKGFFLVPKEYNTMDLTYTLIKSFDLYNRVSELNLYSLYNGILESYFYDDYFLYDGFTSYLSDNDDNSYTGFRSYPLEFYSAGNKDFIDNIGYLLSHKATYQALDSLQRMYKLDDFALTCDLSQLIENIIDTQFLDLAYPTQNGGFLPIMEYNPLRAEMQSKDVFLEYSFYAIKSLELLTEYLNMGDITFLDFEINQFNDYISCHLTETSEILYFQPRYSDDIDILLQNTYYMIYLLKALHLFTLNSEKIEKFIELNIDYTNIKNVYYCYKIIELLDLDFKLNNQAAQELINTLFIASSHDFYQTTDQTTINQEIFLWICEMALNSPLDIIVQYNEIVTLGTYLSISASLSHLVFSVFGYNLSFQFECTQLGVHPMEIENSTHFSLELLVPQRSTNYPIINGKIVAYHNTLQLAEKSIRVQTIYVQKFYGDAVNAAIVLSTVLFCVPGCFIVISGKKTKKRV